MIWSYVIYALTKGQAPRTPLTRVSISTFRAFYVQSFYVGAFLRWDLFYIQVFYVQSSTFGLLRLVALRCLAPSLWARWNLVFLIGSKIGIHAELGGALGKALREILNFKPIVIEYRLNSVPGFFWVEVLLSACWTLDPWDELGPRHIPALLPRDDGFLRLS